MWTYLTFHFEKYRQHGLPLLWNCTCSNFQQQKDAAKQRRKKKRRQNESETDPIYDNVSSSHNDFFSSVSCARGVVASHREIELSWWFLIFKLSKRDTFFLPSRASCERNEKKMCVWWWCWCVGGDNRNWSCRMLKTTRVGTQKEQYVKFMCSVCVSWNWSHETHSAKHWISQMNFIQTPTRTMLNRKKWIKKMLSIVRVRQA